MKTKNSTSISNAVFDTLYDYSQSHYGFAAALAKEMTRISKPKREWSRQHISTYFCKKERRAEPSYGTGVLILEAFSNVRANNEAKGKL